MLLIYTRKSFSLVFPTVLQCFSQMNFYELAAIQFHYDSLEVPGMFLLIFVASFKLT